MYDNDSPLTRLHCSLRLSGGRLVRSGRRLLGRRRLSIVEGSDERLFGAQIAPTKITWRRRELEICWLRRIRTLAAR